MACNTIVGFLTAHICIFLATTAVAQQTDCSADIDTLIEETASDTVAHGASFSRGGGKVVPFTALSRGQILADYSSVGSNIKNIDLCIQYQVTNNAADEVIESLRWPVANVPYYNYPIEPGARSMTFPIPFMAASGMFVGVVEIGAYRTGPVSVRAVRPTFQRTQMPNSNESHPLGPSPAPAPIPDLPTQFGLDPERDFSVRTPSEAEIELPEIRISSMTPDKVQIDYRSGISYDGEQLEFSYRFSASEAQLISAPYLLALREFSPSSSTISETRSIASSMADFTNQASGADGEIEFSLFVDPGNTEFGGISIFYSQHPVSISTENGSTCVMYAIYSPIPISIGEGFCSDGTR